MATQAKKRLLSSTAWIIIGTFAGIIFGALVGPWAGNLKFIGDIFMRLIQMTVIVLVMTSIIASMSNMSGKGVGRISFHTFLWFIIFTVFACAVGLLLGYIIKPGLGISLADATTVESTVEVGNWQDTLLNFVSTNIISSMAKGDMVPCIIFSIFFGVAMGRYVQKTGNTIVSDWTNGLNAIVLDIIEIVMKMAPVGIFCLLADVAGSIGFKIILPMIKFLGAMALADLIMFIVDIPLTAAICKVNPLKMPKKFAKMSLMALTTTSSAICLPTKMEDTVTKFGVSRRISDFVGPLAMSMNSSGAAMHHVLSIVFVSQACGVPLSVPQILMLTVLSCLLCMGTISVPGGTIVTKSFLATAMGLPLDSLSLIIGIDWFAGMFRTIMNVDLDVLVAMLVANKEGELDRDVYNGKKVVEYV